MKIGIFGGTFDPCTIAHYEIVKKILDDRILDKVIVMPSVVTYYRLDKKAMFSYDDRKTILKKFFGDMKNVILDFSEYDFGYSQNRRYIDTLQTCIQKYYKLSDGYIQWYTIIGADSYKNFSSWYNYRDILILSRLLVFERAGYDNNPIEGIPAQFCHFDKDLTSISATNVRAEIESNRNPSEYLDFYLKYVENYMNTMTFENHMNTAAMHNKTAAVLGNSNTDKTEPNDNKVLKNKTITNFEFYKTKDAAKKAYVADQLSSDSRLDNLFEMKAFVKWLYEEHDSDKLIAHTPIFDLVEGPEVEEGFRPVKVKSPDWVTIIVENEDQFLTVMQRRYGIDREMIEFPCGMIEENESAQHAALRELAEETGLSISPDAEARCVKYLGSVYANPAFMTNRMHYFYLNLDKCGKNEVFYHNQELDKHEKITVLWTHKETFRNKVDGIFDDCVSSLMTAGMYLYDKAKR